VNVSLHCRPFQLPHGDLRAILTVARWADEAGLYGIHFGEHVIMGEHIEAYPYPGRPYTHALDASWLEPFGTLCAIASVTERLRLSTGVLLAPLRSAPLLAKSVATLDVLSEGRAELAIGIGWQKEEYVASGVDWDTRYQRLLDTVRACRSLWEKDQAVSFSSKTVAFQRMYCRPQPVQARVPLLFGWGMTDRRARLVAELGDGWAPSLTTLETFTEGVRLLEKGFEAAGRGRDEMIVRATVPEHGEAGPNTSIDAKIAEAQRFVDAGATVVAIGSPTGAKGIGEVKDFIDALSALAVCDRRARRDNANHDHSPPTVQVGTGSLN